MASLRASRYHLADGSAAHASRVGQRTAVVLRELAARPGVGLAGDGTVKRAGLFAVVERY